MKGSNSEVHEDYGTEHIEVINKTKFYLPGEGAATCQVFGYSFSVGDAVVVYVFRPVGEVRFQVGSMVCSDESGALSDVFTLGVRELLVARRVEACSEEDSERLVSLEVVGVSEPASKSLQCCEEADVQVESDVLGTGCEVDR